MRNIVRVIALCSIVILSIGCTKKPTSESVVVVRDQSVRVRIADEPAEQQRGLGGITELAWDEGMLFLFDTKANHTFWMKDMLIPIDIIWIDDNKIIGIAKEVPAPAPGTSDSQLPLYSSPAPVDTVLEVRAGFSDKYDLTPGDAVKD